MDPTTIRNAIAFALVAVCVPAAAQTTVSVGFDYASGKYGEAERSTTWTWPVVFKHTRGPLVFRLSVPYVRSTGTASAGGDRFADTRQTQAGLGDVVVGVLYTAYFDEATGFGIDLGGKIKFATADKAKDLLTTGKQDHTLLAETYRSFGPNSVYATLAWTRKGDPADTDFRDPWALGIGFGRKLSDATSLDLSYDYRQKVTAGGDPISEATLSVTHKYSKQFKVQAYAVVGFSEASPDAGLGAVVSLGF